MLLTHPHTANTVLTNIILQANPTSQKEKCIKQVVPEQTKYQTEGFRTIPKWQSSLLQTDTVREPVDYFTDYFTPDFIDLIIEQSNLFWRQHNVNFDLNMKISELHIFIGISMYMGVYGLP